MKESVQMANDNIKYIYNPYQVKFYISNGVLPLDVNIHNKTKRTFWVFDTQATEKVYSMWCNQCKDHKESLVG